MKSPVRAALVIALVLAVSACSGESAQDADAPEAAVSAAQDVATEDVPEAAAPAAAGTAQPGHPMVGPMPALGGGMQALAEHCGDYPAAELADLKKQQRELAIQSGMSGASFDAEYNKGYNDALAKIRQGTPAEREKACAQMEELMRFGEEMERRQATRQR